VKGVVGYVPLSIGVSIDEATIRPLIPNIN